MSTLFQLYILGRQCMHLFISGLYISMFHWRNAVKEMLVKNLLSSCSCCVYLRRDMVKFLLKVLTSKIRM